MNEQSKKKCCNPTPFPNPIWYGPLQGGLRFWLLSLFFFTYSTGLAAPRQFPTESIAFATGTNFECQRRIQEDSLSRFQASRPCMGVQFTITAYCRDQETAELAFNDAFAAIDRVDMLFSNYNPNSPINRLPQLIDQQGNVHLDPELLTLFVRAQAIVDHTNGSFDYTLGNLTKLWRDARQQQRLPSDEDIRSAVEASGANQVIFDEQAGTLTFRSDTVRFDFGGIAKGYAADLALATLKRHGVNRAMVNAAGDLALGERPPDADGWRIAISDSLDSEPFQAVSYVLLSNCGVATSGDKQQFVFINGRRYSHILNPRTGVGMIGHRQVTVIAPDATAADAYASAFNVMSLKDARQLLKECDSLAARIFVINEMHESPSHGSFDQPSFQSENFPEIHTVRQRYESKAKH